MIYCTHSHYLLDPETIPISSIAVAEKEGTGNIILTPLPNYRGTIYEKRSALQPLMDALQIKPFVLDLTNKKTIITEGICDYFALEMFKGKRNISILPSVGADSIKFYISLMIAWQMEFMALWDNDNKGKHCYADAQSLFGTEIANRCLRLLPSENGRKRVLQDLFYGDDLHNIRQELLLPTECSFEKVINVLFYSPNRLDLVSRMSSTRSNFDTLFLSLDV